MKKKSLLFSFLLLFCLVFTLASIKQVNAATSDNGNATFNVNSQTTKKWDYTTQQTIQGTTIYNQSSYAQQVNYFVQDQTENSKVVTWAVANSDGTGFKLQSLVRIAEDWEKNHPGWRVVGGINADQYFTKAGDDLTKGHDYFAPQPYYPMIADGETWFGTTGYVNSSSGSFVGILQDGSNDPLVNGTANIHNGDTKLTGLYLSIIDEEGEVLEKFQLQGLNTVPGDNEATIFMPYITDTLGTIPSITTTGNLYVVNDSELSYVNNTVAYKSYKDGNALDSCFARGTITSVEASAEIAAGQFAINSNNETLNAALATGKRIRVQYEFPGVMNTVESAIGFHTIQRMNDQDLPTTASYNTQKYPRALIGRTATGQIVLIAIDGRQEAKGMCGTSHDETNAILKQYGCVEAYQMDGGGSVTAIIRNENDKFVVVNSPSDGSTRSVLSGLLMVERCKPEVEFDITPTSSGGSFALKVTEDYGYNIDSFVLEVNSKEYEFDNNKTTVSGLRYSSQFEYSLYMISNGTKLTIMRGTFSTLANLPVVSKCTLSGDTFTVTIADRSKILTDSYFLVGDERFAIVDGKATVSGDGIVFLVLEYDAGYGAVVEKIAFPHSVFLQICHTMSDRSDALAGIYN